MSSSMMPSAPSRTGVIRSTHDYLMAPSSPDPGSPAGSEDVCAPSPISTVSGDDDSPRINSSRENPREIRNKAEKQRRDKLNRSIAELAAMVPPVAAANRKIDKTGVLRLTAHYLRSHQYVFGDSIGKSGPELSPATAPLLLSLLGGFLLTTTYRGIIVVVSQNIQQYLGHAELDLLGQNIFNYIHPDDFQTMKDNLMPKKEFLGPNGELLIPDEPDGKQKIEAALIGEKRRFLIKFKKHSQRSEPVTYVLCFVEGTLRKSDKACRGINRGAHLVRRSRAKGDNTYSSGNDIVFIGLVRPATETFLTEKRMESFRMEYRTRHSVDGEIMECEQRISLVAGYMTHEVFGVNAMNFIHRDDVRWVIFNLREMYDQHRLVGESCYRLMAKNGQFIYMWTRGSLDVDEDTRAVRSFVCTNTVVGEDEGRHLIRMMKNKCMMIITNQKLAPLEIEELKHFDGTIPEGEVTEDKTLPVQDLEKVILHLVTDLPSPQPGGSRGNSPERGESLPLAIIPPRRERIVSAIEKIYSVIKAATTTTRKDTMLNQNRKVDDSGTSSPSQTRSPVRFAARLEERARHNKTLRRQLEGHSVPYSDQPMETQDHFSCIMPLQGLTSNFTLQPADASTATVQSGMQSVFVPEMSPIDECAIGLMQIDPICNSRKRSLSTTGLNIKKPNNGLPSDGHASFTAEATPLGANVPPFALIDGMIPLPDAFAEIKDDHDNDEADASIDDIEPSINLLWEFPEAI